ncbi:MAG: endonuclease/exonuclease/phosphatase family protein [Rikenellaceae bacterium]
MKKLLLSLAVSLALVSCSTAPKEAPEESKELKVMSWNIWHAGHSKAYPEVGCQGTMNIIKDSEADVIMMIETYGASDQVADHLGYYHRLISSNLSIYSRYPITKTLTFPDSISTFNFGGVEIDMNGQKVRVFDTWLHYLPDERLVPTDLTHEQIIEWEKAGSRDDELRAILNTIAPYLAEADSIPVIMGGDFNIHSHLDWTEATKDMYHHGGAVVEWPVSKLMERAGFRDSFREANPDPTVNLGNTWMHPVDEDKANNQWREDRIDYIYSKGANIETVDSEIYNQELGKMLDFKGKQYFYASDHGFVLTTFKIK